MSIEVVPHLDPFDPGRNAPSGGPHRNRLVRRRWRRNSGGKSQLGNLAVVKVRRRV